MINLITNESMSGSHWAFFDRFDDYCIVAPGHARLTDNDGVCVASSMPLNLQADFNSAPRGALYSYNKNHLRQKTEEGIRRWTVAHTFSRTHVQRYLFSFLICDFDPGCDIEESARLMAEDGLQPHRVLSCMHTGGVQTWHRLAVPVSWKNDKRRQVMREVCAGMAERYGADPQYRNGCVAGYSPYSPQMWGLEIEDGAGERAYELEKLHEYMCGAEFIEKMNVLRVRNRHSTLGRNDAFFKTFRTSAMPEVRKFDNESDWLDWCIGSAQAVHDSVVKGNPLSWGEIKSTAKSVAGWVWRNRHQFKTNPASHYVNGVARGLVNAIATDKRAQMVQAMRMGGESIESIAGNMEIGQSTVYRLLHRELDERGKSFQTRRVSKKMTALQ